MRCTAVFVGLLVVGLGRAAEKEEGFVPLFNGKDLTGWKQYQGRTDNWRVEDGLLVCTGKGGGGWLGTEREYADLVLRLEYRLKPGGNSGVYLRAPEKGRISQVGMEIQILDDHDPRYEKMNLKPYQYTGSIYGVVPPKKSAIKPAGEWNRMEITARGRHVTVVVNGEKVVDADLDHYLKDPEVAKAHPGLKRTTGHIGLQDHNERVEFRNLRIREK
jgi:hypothetical protein